MSFTLQSKTLPEEKPPRYHQNGVYPEVTVAEGEKTTPKWALGMILYGGCLTAGMVVMVILGVLYIRKVEDRCLPVRCHDNKRTRDEKRYLLYYYKIWCA